MKRITFLLTVLAVTLTAFAKDIQTLVVTTIPQMHCDNCEAKIKGNIRFEKGVKKILTDIPSQRVTITYDADKTTPEVLMEAFQKFGYEAYPVDSLATDQIPADATNCCPAE